LFACKDGGHGFSTGAEALLLLVEISERVEATADKLFKTIQGNHQKIADNYLSLKAYSHAAANGVKAYIAKGKGRNLSSLGDLLQSISSLAAIKNKKEEGLGAGGKAVPPIFAGKQVPTPGTMTKINALVNEYINVVTQVRRRWPMGLGKYLLMKTEESMQGKGVLQVDKLSDHAGNFVFVNGRAVGLSNRLNDFEKLAVRLNKYEAALAALTAKMAKKHAKKGPKINYVKGPEWPGN
jgi:predicted ribosome-associated RNA-binding protein Tma20